MQELIYLSGMLFTIGKTGFRTNSIFTKKCKKEKNVKEKSEHAPTLPASQKVAPLKDQYGNSVKYPIVHPAFLPFYGFINIKITK